MPRTVRLDEPGLIQHVIARGIERRNIFLDDQDYKFFIKKLETILIDTATPCYAWVLMSNHFHLAIRTGNLPLSKIMHRLLGSYAIYFNRRHERSGHLFQNRYKSTVVEEDSYLAALISYIHLNPIRAGLIKDISELNKYSWSGHLALTNEKNCKWQDTKFITHFFGSEKSYLNYLASQNDEELSDLDGGLRRGLEKDSDSLDKRILGSGEYVTRLLEKKNITSPRPSTSLFEQLTLTVCKYYHLTDQELRGSSRVRKVSIARGAIAFLAVTHGFSYAKIAKELNLTHPAIIKAVTRGNKIISENPKIKDMLSVG